MAYIKKIKKIWIPFILFLFLFLFELSFFTWYSNKEKNVIFEKRIAKTVLEQEMKEQADANKLFLLDNQKAEKRKKEELFITKDLSEVESENHLQNDQNSVYKDNFEKQKNDSSFSFVAIGDAESYDSEFGFNKELLAVMNKAKGYNPDFAFFTGDIIAGTGDCRKKVLEVKKQIGARFMEYYLVLAKHDLEGTGCLEQWQEIFWGKEYQQGEKKQLYYSFDYKNTHFVLLSTDYPYKYSLDKVQIAWLKKDLESTDKPNKIVLGHTPLITFFKESAEECHDFSCSKAVQKEVLKILQDNKVDVVIAGHEHSFAYKESNGIDFVLSGNCGNGGRYPGQIGGDIFSFFKVDENNIFLQAIRVDGKIIKEIKIK